MCRYWRPVDLYAIWYAAIMPRQLTHAGPAEEPKHPDASVPPAEPTAEPAQVSIVDEVLSLKRSWESKKEAAIQELLKKRTAIEKAFNENLKEIEDQLPELGDRKSVV